MTVRRTLTPFPGVPEPDTGKHAMRRAEARTEASVRIVLRAEDRLLDGWALNTSKGGLRAILEEKVELGALFDVRCGVDQWRPGRVVWIQDEPDGCIIGVAYLDAQSQSSMPSVSSSAAPSAAPTATSASTSGDGTAAKGNDDVPGSTIPSTQKSGGSE